LLAAPAGRHRLYPDGIHLPHSNKIQRQLEASLTEERYAAFKAELEASKSSLYFGDNRGEVVLNRWLIDSISRASDLEVTWIRLS
jgi:uncharacterized protein with ATP-grasp and redox domains